MLLNLSWPAVSLQLFTVIRLAWHSECWINHMLDYKRKSTDATVKSVSIITGGWRGEVGKVEGFVVSAEKGSQFIFIFIIDYNNTNHSQMRTRRVHYVRDQHVIRFALIISSQQSFKKRFFTSWLKGKRKTHITAHDNLLVFTVPYPSLVWLHFFQNRIWCRKEDRWGVTCQWAVKTDSEGAVDAG